MRVEPAKTRYWWAGLTARRWPFLALAAGLGLLLFSCNQSTRRTDVAAPPALKEREPSAALGLPNAYVVHEPEIRVAVLKDARELRLSAPGAAQLSTADRRQDLAALAPGQEVLLAAGHSALMIAGAERAGLSGVRLTSRRGEAFIRLNGEDLAPDVVVYRDPARGGLLTVVAYLRLEDYLAGVLAGEVPYASWHPEALKAQAVASRSYALFEMKQHAQAPYDVECSTMSQVFKAGAHRPAVLLAAVQATRGLILTSDGRLFPAYFHSTCGGHTSAVESVFPQQTAVRCLRGVTCPFCGASGAYRWSLRLSKSEIRSRLAASGETVGAVAGLEFLGGSGSPPRAETVRVRHSGGVLALPANRFRLEIGARDLKSVQLEGLTENGAVFDFQGRGYGHGVGLCQWGSQGMAQQGYSALQILGFYYAGGELTRLYGGAETAGR